MLSEVKKVLLDFASGLSRALSTSLELIISFFRLKSSTSKNTSESSSFNGNKTSTDRNTQMTKDLFDKPISKEDVLRSVNTRTQKTVDMSSQLEQTQKLVNASKSQQVANKEQTEKDPSKTHGPRI